LAKFLGGNSIEASQEQAARDSNYDIDKFVLSLWLAGSPARLFHVIEASGNGPELLSKVLGAS
jgi:hypothetical protein